MSKDTAMANAGHSLGLETQSHTLANPENEEDVHLWLQFTNYFDTGYRRNILGRLKCLKKLDETRATLDREIRALMSDSYPPPATPGVPFSTPRRYRNSSTPSSTLLDNIDLEEGEQNICNRALAVEDPKETTTTIQEDLESEHPQKDTMSNKSYIEEEMSISTDGQTHPYKASPGKGKGDGNIQTPKGSAAFNSLLARVNLPPRPRAMDEEDKMFFVLKAESQDMIRLSQRHGVWVCQTSATTRLRDAYRSRRDVFLLFTVHQSKRFHGYAKMASHPISDTKWPSGMRPFEKKFGEMFDVQWISTKVRHFNDMEHIRGPKTNKPCSLASDGDIISAHEGELLLAVLQ